MQKLENNEVQPKFTCCYKKKRVLHLYHFQFKPSCLQTGILMNALAPSIKTLVLGTVNCCYTKNEASFSMYC